jgi:Cu/Ag efflux protein CusF
LLAVAALAAGACSRPAAEESKEPVKRYELRGEVKSLDAEAKTAKIQHDKIGDWMEAMTMEFPVRDPADFARLRAGQPVKATVFVQGLRFWVGEVEAGGQPSPGGVAPKQP